MSAVELAIVQPTHDASFTGTEPVTFRGKLAGEPTEVPEEVEGVTFYYRWYSSLFSGSETDLEEERFAMNVVEGVVLTDPESAYTPSQPLGVGSHVISFATTDQRDETTAAQEAVLHGGVTGGAEGDGQCIIHVFRANLLTPGNGALLSRANETLEAEAPTLWGIKNVDSDLYEPNQEYHKLNRLQYRWHFAPIGAPVGRVAVDFVPSLEELQFREPADAIAVTHLHYAGPLPSELNGGYNLTLHVEDHEGQLGGHAMTVTGIQVGP